MNILLLIHPRGVKGAHDFFGFDSSGKRETRASPGTHFYPCNIQTLTNWILVEFRLLCGNVLVAIYLDKFRYLDKNETIFCYL